MSNITEEEFAAMEEVEDWVEEDILKYGVLTGSALFYSSNGATDIDYIMPPDCVELIQDITSFKAMQEVIYGDTSTTFPMYVKLRKYNKPVNLIFTNHDATFQAWVLTTSAVHDIIDRHMPIFEALKIRDNRVALFSTIRNMLLSKEDKKNE